MTTGPYQQQSVPQQGAGDLRPGVDQRHGGGHVTQDQQRHGHRGVDVRLADVAEDLAQQTFQYMSDGIYVTDLLFK